MWFSLRLCLSFRPSGLTLQKNKSSGTSRMRVILGNERHSTFVDKTGAGVLSGMNIDLGWGESRLFRCSSEEAVGSEGMFLPVVPSV